MIPTSQGMRIVPELPAAAYKTYAISSPLATHYRDASCSEVDCQAQEHGWRTVVDESTDLGQRQAAYIRRESGRKYTEERQPDTLTAFTFEAGQTCFESHKVSLQRPELFLVRGGDWRGNPRGDLPFQHGSPESWLDDFGTHQESLAEHIERG